MKREKIFSSRAFLFLLEELSLGGATVKDYNDGMNQKLTSEQRERIYDALDFAIDYKALQTPEEWHQFTIQWNWDDGLKPLEWVTLQPECDFGTALYIYWNVDPVHYYQYAGREAFQENRFDMESYDFLKALEQRLLSGFYQRREIRFDPTNAQALGDDLTDLNGVTLIQAIPQSLMQASPGEEVQREQLLEIVIRPLNEQEKVTVSAQLRNGEEVLREYASHLSVVDQPTVIVDAIESVVETYRTALPPLAQPEDNAKIMSLGWLWCQQLCRAYGWEWLAWDYGRGASVGVFSPSHQYVSFPPNLIRYTISVRLCPNSIRALFDQLRSVKATQDLAKAYGSGWVMLNPYYESEVE